MASFSFHGSVFIPISIIILLYKAFVMRGTRIERCRLFI